MGKRVNEELRGYAAAPQPARMRRAVLGFALLGIAVLSRSLGAATSMLPRQSRRPRSVGDVLTEFGPEAEARWRAAFKKLGVHYPPHEIALIGMKSERTLGVWVRDDAAAFKHLKTYPVLGASGTLGPKLREGDLQVPEGVYRITVLNPNSRFHLSLRVDYPNAFDRAQAERDGRTKLGGDIYIHGGSASIGCLALGDAAIEALFVLVARTGRERVRVVIAPHEPSSGKLAAREPAWTSKLYRDIVQALEDIRSNVR